METRCQANFIGRFGHHSEMSGVTRAKESRPREGNRESGSERRAVVEHRDPGEQMLHRRNVDVCPIGAGAGVETGNIHECAALNQQEG